MQKTKWMLCVICFIFGAVLWLNPMKVRAEYYCWDSEMVEGDEGMEAVSGWYKGGWASNPASVKMDEAPSGLTDTDTIYIVAKPDEECLQWLQELSGKIASIEIYYYGETSGETIQIGKPGGDLSLFSISSSSSVGVDFYGDLISMSVRMGNITINGNVGMITLGNTLNSNIPILSNGTVVVNGDVESITWYETSKSSEIEDSYYGGFTGDIIVNGTVRTGTIYSAVYDPAIKKDSWQETGRFEECAEGVFSIISGVLAESVPVTEIPPQLGNYVYRYICILSEYGNLWQREAYNIETPGVIAYREEWKEEDVPADSNIFVDGSGNLNGGGSLTLDFDVDSLYIQAMNGNDMHISINGNISRLTASIFPGSVSDISISGNVDDMVLEYAFTKCSMTIGGSVSGCYKVNRNNVVSVAGWFDAENMQILKDGKWNPELYIRANYLEDSAVSFKPVHPDEVADALPDSYGIGQEVDVVTAEGQKTLVKASEAYISMTEETVLKGLEEKEDMKKIINQLQSEQEMEEAAPICAVDIDVNTYYKDKATGTVYEDASYKTENVKQLKEGEALAFSVKIPPVYYEADSKYVIVRNHVDEAGISSMSILDTVQNGDVLTFSSDKFSTFVIVKLKQKENVDVGDKPEEGQKPGGEESGEQKPEDKPEQKPEDKPEQKPEDKPEQKPEDKPEQEPEDKPEQEPEGGGADSESPNPERPGNTVSDGDDSRDEENVSIEDKENSGASVRIKDDVPNTGDPTSLAAPMILAFFCMLLFGLTVVVDRKSDIKDMRK